MVNETENGRVFCMDSTEISKEFDPLSGLAQHHLVTFDGDAVHLLEPALAEQ
jgi:hypothetical protein